MFKKIVMGADEDTIKINIKVNNNLKLQTN